MLCIVNLYAAAGKSGAAFLLETAGARQLSMGSAFCSIADDASLISANPAGMNYLVYPELITMYRKGLLDSSYAFAGVVLPAKKRATFEIGAFNFDSGAIDINNIDGTSRRVKAEQDSILSLGAGTNLGERFFTGLNLKFITSTLAGEYSASALSYDLGFIYRPPDDRLSFGFSLLNYGTGLKYKTVTDPLPSSARAGVSYKIFRGANEARVVSADVVMPADEPMQYNLGLEQRIGGILLLRGGFIMGQAGQSAGVLTFGIGMRLFNGQFDYGYLPQIDESSHKMSFTMRFGQPVKDSLKTFDAGVKYYDKGMPGRAKAFLARIPKDNSSYAMAQEKISAIDTDMARNNAISIAKARELKSARKGLITQSAAKPPALIINKDNIHFSDDTNDNVLSALENGRIRFFLENPKGTGAAFDVRAYITCSNPEEDIDYTRNISLGDMRPGAEKMVEIKLYAGAKLKTGKLNFTVTFSEKYGFPPDSLVVEIPAMEMKEPDIQIAKTEIDDGRYENDDKRMCVGNGDGIIQEGESVEVILTILNKGRGASRNLRIKPGSSSPDAPVIAGQDGIKIDELKPGEFKKLFFAFSVSRLYCGNQKLPLTIFVNEERQIFNKILPVELSLGVSNLKVQMAKFEGNKETAAPVTMPTFGADLFPAPLSRSANSDAVGVIIGVRNYKNRDVPQVEYALADAQAVKEYLIKALGFAEGNIIALENPTKGDFERVFGTKDDKKGQLFNYVKSGKSDVFVYYAGHGAPDIESKKAYFVPSDCNPAYVKLNGYPLELLYENLSRIPARTKSVVIDACFSGSSEKGNLIAKASPLAITPIFSALEGLDVLTASGADQISSWYPDKQHSLFTYYFLKGLQGEADKNRDKNITFGELKDYLDENVPYTARRLEGREQAPTFTGDRNRIVARY